MTAPSVYALAASIAYLLTACVCLAARRVSKSFWTPISVILLLLALDRAIGLHNLPSNAARDLAREYHLYENRHVVQFCLIFMVVLVGVVGLAAIFRLARRRPMRYRVATAGMVLIILFALLRVTSYHPLDDLFELSIAGVQFRVVLEFLPLLGILVPAGMDWRVPSRCSGARSLEL